MNGLPAVSQTGVFELIQQVKTFAIAEKGKAVHAFFEQDKGAEGIVVLDGCAAAGIIMRTDFYQKMGQQYGYSLYANRPLEILMKKEILCVETDVELSALGMLSMNRKPENLYDYIIVCQNHAYIGIVSIRDFLVEMSKAKEREIQLLKNQQDILREANEKERAFRMQVEQMNGALSERNASIKNLLDNAEQGFFQFSSRRTIAPEYSQVCIRIFGSEIGGCDVLEVLAAHMDAGMVQTMGRTIEGMFGAADPALREVYLSLLPEELVIHGRTIRFQYKLVDSVQGDSVLVIMTDISIKKQLDAKLAQDKSNVKLVMRALSHGAEVRHAVHGFQAFAADLKEQAAALLENPSALRPLYRQVHTIKGDLAQIGMLHAAAALHRVEDDLAQWLSCGPATGDLIAAVEPVWNGGVLEQDVRVITDALGPGFFEETGAMTIPRERLEAVEQEVLQAVDLQARHAVAQRLARLRYFSLRQEICKYDEYLSFVAQGLSKAIEPIRFVGNDLYLDGRRYGDFVKSLVHVFRNSIDHGIESPEDRENLGKSPLGVLACAVRAEGDQFRMTICDDGQGLDTERLTRKAVEKGILSPADAPAMSEAETFALVFADGLSTKEDVTALSGRGVGMAAVRQEVLKLGGTVHIDSKPGEGTSFTFLLPLDE